MTNIERAAEVLADWADSLGGLSAIDRDYDGDLTGGAEALADAGLLAPDLPAPDYTGSITAWMDDDPVLTVTEHSILGVSLISEINEQGTGAAEINLTVEGARDLAAALLAAAAWAEKHE